MAEKDLEVKMKVDSSQVDEATKKVDKLNDSVKKTETTTKDYGKSVKIAFDESGKAVDVLVDKELSLTKQIRAVKAQMEILTATGKAQGQEFTVLQRKFNDLNDNLSKNKARSQELFGTLSLLPGPVGEFSSKLQGGLDLLKTFSGVRLQDLKNQFKGVVDDLKEIFAGFSEFTKKTTEAGKGAGTGTGTGAGAETAAKPTVAAGADPVTEAIKRREAALASYRAKTTEVVKEYDAATGQMVTKTVNLTNADKNLGKTAEGTTDSLKGQTNQTNQLTAAETAATTATTLLKAALAALGIGLIIGAIVAVVNMLSELIFKTKESTKAFNDFNEGLKLSKESLDDELVTIQNWSQNRVNILKKQNVDASKIRDEEIEGVKKQREAVEREIKGMDATVQDALDTYMKYKGGLINNMFYKEEATKALENYNNALNQQKELTRKYVALNQDITNKGVQNDLQTTQEAYAKKLADLDAHIQLEINSQETNSTKLKKLLDERADMVIKHDKLQFYQQELLKKENNKKVEEALDEDSKRIEAYYHKTEDIEISAIEKTEKGKEEAELRTRTAKLNRDIEALTYDKEFIKSSAEEKQKIIDNLNKAAEQDETAIKENYAKRRLEIQNQLIDLNIKSIKDEVVRARVERLKQFKEEKEKLDELLKEKRITQEEYNKAIINMQKAFANDINKINDDAKIKDLETQKGVDETRLKIYEMNSEKSNAARLGFLTQYYDAQRKVEDDNYEIQKIKAKDNANELNRIELEHQQAKTAIAESERSARFEIYQKGLDDLINIAAAESDLQKGLMVAKQAMLAWELAMEIKKTITFSTQAAARSTVAVAEGTAQTAKIGFPQNIPMLIGYAIQAAAIISSIVSAVNSAKSSASASGGGGDSFNRGKNYGDGGMINGPSHNSPQGGVPIMAEGGEAVMTRGAVTMFRPLLSMLNQAGGGTSFSGAAMGQAPYDAPEKNNVLTEQPIIKTYVVENELTTIQERQARLKSLSTL